MGDFKPLQFTPGVAREGSDKIVPGRWFDASLVRWVDKSLRPVGGWTKLFGGASQGTVRAVFSWTDLSLNVRQAFITNTNVYVIESDGTLRDITPTGFATITTDFNQAGFGYGLFGTGNFGTPRPLNSYRRVVGPAFTMNNWGQDLIFMTSVDGRLFRWQPGSNDVAKPVPNAPTNNRMFLVTPEQYVVLIGVGGLPQWFGWCDQQNIESWNFTSTTGSAGQLPVSPMSPIYSAISTRQGMLMFTENGPSVSRYSGLPYVYGSEKITNNSSPMTPECLVEIPSGAAWMSDDGFSMFDGTSVASIPCEVLDWFLRNRNSTYSRNTAFGINVGVFNEIWWFFPSMGATANDTYVVWNYVDGWWSMGKLARTCGFSGKYTTYPIMSDGAALYNHEQGASMPGAPSLPYARTSAFNKNSGANIGRIRQAMVNNVTSNKDVNYTFSGAFNRNINGDEVTWGPSQARDDGYLDVRMSARDVRITVQSSRDGVDPWTFGEMLVDSGTGGSR